MADTGSSVSIFQYRLTFENGPGYANPNDNLIRGLSRTVRLGPQRTVRLIIQLPKSKHPTMLLPARSDWNDPTTQIPEAKRCIHMAELNVISDTRQQPLHMHGIIGLPDLYKLGINVNAMINAANNGYRPQLTIHEDVSIQSVRDEGLVLQIPDGRGSKATGYRVYEVSQRVFQDLVAVPAPRAITTVAEALDHVEVATPTVKPQRAEANYLPPIQNDYMSFLVATTRAQSGTVHLLVGVNNDNTVTFPGGVSNTNFDTTFLDTATRHAARQTGVRQFTATPWTTETIQIQDRGGRSVLCVLNYIDAATLKQPQTDRQSPTFMPLEGGSRRQKGAQLLSVDEIQRYVLANSYKLHPTLDWVVAHRITPVAAGSHLVL